ncbi:probable E3 ubiquitin-protein ligase RHG1A isoform X1 [Neltuma alba]|uniref:probable E3 ubiquitin-protein ligase RHG1A isoform X1 n=1 Tax=Neltuma alba TaxID=207710 RepID=UPI0010A4970D|nr:probable E3 ubiquitin-protein ligase RHG1A isoform X1 [Prosopis alba]XP_028775972.1 probable E3 ubiquitin-protein ligase RHG1A isoform X1 [Prosopis alba]XP_028775973.1 probable E3 ubiquitin-protein ligase RHG1A isoform X1 [Prosopis alba]XP_028775974.1 probable E3 ubiquitin-protein ligase RHG1A isoform X1 [Prosopis alba]XP_028775975.1 probable E3 ubiquitin-protein ligase RHG1A isoform X1 [Prosopis alba]XP_028775976.1 probable E3 ubiquitin-protein ligase RHG1A isoform X1 [Prosopis alba]XP_02
MGHRHLYSMSQMFGSEQEQNWNYMHTDQHNGRGSASENGSFIYPLENMPIDGSSLAASWNNAAMSNGYASSSINIELPPRQSDASRSSHDHYLRSSNPGAFFAVSENYAHQPSSNCDRQAFHVADGDFFDFTMGSGRGPHKRKSPGIPSVCERGSTSRYFSAGSSTDLPISSEIRQEKPSLDSQFLPWDHVTMTPPFRGSGLSIRGEGSLRNVRSRSALDLESNLARTHLCGNHLHNSSSGPSNDHSSSVGLSGHSSNTVPRDWSQMNMSPAPGRVLLSESSGYNHEPSRLLVGSGVSNASVDAGSYHHEYDTSINPIVPQSFHSNLTHPARGVRSNYSQRSTPTPTPTFRASSSSCVGHMMPSDGGLHMGAEGLISRHPRPLTAVSSRNTDRNGRSRISSERYRTLADEAILHDRFSSEGFMVVDRAPFYGSRNMIDQHRDMRMDIDNMSYEELLALGERIGHVSTGLSEKLISKCLTESIYCSSEQSQEEGSCVICLEDYKYMDDVGTLRGCGHDYHVSCIRKWLSMKNICPICKASALPDEMKDK